MVNYQNSNITSRTGAVSHRKCNPFLTDTPVTLLLKVKGLSFTSIWSGWRAHPWRQAFWTFPAPPGQTIFWLTQCLIDGIVPTSHSLSWLDIFSPKATRSSIQLFNLHNRLLANSSLADRTRSSGTVGILLLLVINELGNQQMVSTYTQLRKKVYTLLSYGYSKEMIP